MFTCKRIPPQTPPQAKLMRQSSRGNFLRRTSTALARGCVCAFKNWELRISWHKLDKVVLFFFVGAYDWFLKRSNSFLCYGLSLRCLYFVGTVLCLHVCCSHPRREWLHHGWGTSRIKCFNNLKIHAHPSLFSVFSQNRSLIFFFYNFLNEKLQKKKVLKQYSMEKIL